MNSWLAFVLGAVVVVGGGFAIYEATRPPTLAESMSDMLSQTATAAKDLNAALNAPSAPQVPTRNPIDMCNDDKGPLPNCQVVNLNGTSKQNPYVAYAPPGGCLAWVQSEQITSIAQHLNGNGKWKSGYYDIVGEGEVAFFTPRFGETRVGYTCRQ